MTDSSDYPPGIPVRTLKKTAYFFLSLIAFCFPISIAASSVVFFPCIGLYVLFALWTFKIWPPKWGAIESAFAVFWGISLLSALLGVDPLHSRVRLSKDLYVVLLIFMGAVLRKEPAEKGTTWMTLFLWGGLMTACYGILQSAVGINRIESTSPLTHVPAFLSNAPQAFLNKLSLVGGRATGLRGHPLTFGETLLFPLAYTLSLLATESKKPWRKAAYAQCILLLALLYSQSRGPWIAFGAMTGVLCVLEVPRAQLLRRIWAVVVFPIVLVICIPALHQRAVTIGDVGFDSNAERILMWKAGARIVKDHPLLGVGTGNVRRVSVQYQTPEQHALYGDWGHLHNTYINIAAERGLLGLAAFLFFIGSLGWTLLRGHRHIPREQKQERTLVLTALLGLTGWLVSGLTEAVYNDSSILMMFYFVMGLGLAYCRTWREWSR